MIPARPSREAFVAASAALHGRARAFVYAFEKGVAPPEPFDALAVDLARFQAAHGEGYARLCHARGLDPARFRVASDAPAVPTDAFKMARVSALPEGEPCVVFRTSGTTVGARGSHAFADLGSYDAGALAFGRRALAADMPERFPVLVVGPSPADAPDSSLTHMNGLFVDAWGEGSSHDDAFFVRDDALDLAALDERLARLIVGGGPGALVLGTSFAFVHLLDAIGDDGTFSLPPGSRVMQTGGFKGQSREVDGPTLKRELARIFAIPEHAILSEYGMTELSSQFYEGSVAGETPPGVYREPPWARVVPVDPDTLEPVGPGEVGIARIEDLMNVDSAFAVLASDRVRRVEGGFELLGRAPGAAPRGCSIAVDELLGR